MKALEDELLDIMHAQPAMKNDRVEELGVFGATLITFFLAEMGDKTQIATVALAAHFSQPLLVVAGTTAGMLIADVPAVFIGNKFADKIPMTLVHRIAAGIFAFLGLITLLGNPTEWMS